MERWAPKTAREWPRSNGAGRLPPKPRWRSRVALVIAALVLVGTIPRGCAIYFGVDQAKIDAGVETLREIGEREGWTDEKIEQAIARLRERYRSDR